MDKKTSLLCFILFIISIPSLLVAQNKVQVVAEKANIYAEPHDRAHLIESVKKGTVLTLFQKGIIRNAWYYVSFDSQRYRGRATGFIRMEQVEPWSETTQAETKPVEPPKAEEQPPTIKPELKTIVKPPPEPEAKKEPEIIIEESQATTLLPPQYTLQLPQEKAELRESIWQSIDQEYTQTFLPAPLAIALPMQYPAPRELAWRTSETKSALTQLPAGQVLDHLEAQNALQTKEYAQPKPPPPPPEPSASSLKPEAVDYSDSVRSTRSLNSLIFSLNIGPYSRFRHFEMPEPNRLVIDFFEVDENADFQRHPIDDMGIESIRVAMFEETTARVVFDFFGEIPAYQIEQIADGLKLLFWAEAAEPQEKLAAEPAQKALPLPEPEVEPETKIEELPADTVLPNAAVWALPLEHSLSEESVWIAREEASSVTSLSPGLALNLPESQPPLQPIFWTAARPIPEKREELAKPVPIQPPVKEPPEKVELGETEPDKKKEEVVEEAPPEQVIPKPEISPQVIPPRKTGPLTLSLGVGVSTGGAGGFVQYNIKGGLALHAGLGMYPASFIYSGSDWVNNEMLYSVGVKYYLPFKSRFLRPYLDVQYGGFAIEAVQIIMGIWEYQYIFQNEQKALYGPTALVGGEVKLGTLGLNLAAGVSYAATAWEWKSQDFYFSFDVSLIYAFK